MGRSGGRGGGGRSGGGRLGGTRSSGRSARSSGSSSFGRSSYSSSSGRTSYGSSFGRSTSTGGFSSSRPSYPSRPPRVNINLGRGMFGRGYIPNVPPVNNVPTQPTYTPPQQPVYTAPRKKSGCLTSIIVVIIFIVLIMLIFGAVADDVLDITKSTIERNKLNTKVSTEAGFYTDECGWIQNRTVLENGLKEFYNDTGIVPYVYIIDNIEGDYDPSTEKIEQFAQQQYEKLFKDDGHILLMFWDYEGAYEYHLWLGDDTVNIMDTEACDILFDYLDYYYYYADTDEEFFADAFADAGNRIMHVTRSPLYYIFIIGGAGAVIFAVCAVIKSRKDNEAERKRRAEEILNSPLEKFGQDGDVLDNLEKKYEKEIE